MFNYHYVLIVMLHAVMLYNNQSQSASPVSAAQAQTWTQDIQASVPCKPADTDGCRGGKEGQK